MKTWRIALLVLMIGCRDETPVPAPAPAPPPAAAPEPVRCTEAPDRLCPVDEGTGDASFDAFRHELLSALQQNDEAKLLTLLDPGIRTSFGGGGGIEDFKKQWKTLAPELKKVVSLGGTFAGQGAEASFWTPYVYSAWPESKDAFQHVAAIRTDVAIRKEPSPTAAIVATVHWGILELLPAQTESREWLHVKTAGGHEGWVHGDDVHSPVGYRAGFSRRSGRWKMDAFVAGD